MLKDTKDEDDCDGNGMARVTIMMTTMMVLVVMVVMR